MSVKSGHCTPGVKRRVWVDKISYDGSATPINDTEIFPGLQQNVTFDHSQVNPTALIVAVTETLVAAIGVEFGYKVIGGSFTALKTFSSITGGTTTAAETVLRQTLADVDFSQIPANASFACRKPAQSGADGEVDIYLEYELVENNPKDTN